MPILIKPNRAASEAQKVFGFRWFLPELFREWRLFVDVAIAAILLYALGLALPIFFQLVIDKVLVHESFTTLYVLAAGAAGALAFDAIIQFSAPLPTALCDQQGRHSRCDQDIRPPAGPADHVL